MFCQANSYKWLKSPVLQGSEGELCNSEWKSTDHGVPHKCCDHAQSTVLRSFLISFPIIFDFYIDLVEFEGTFISHHKLKLTADVDSHQRVSHESKFRGLGLSLFRPP